MRSSFACCTASIFLTCAAVQNSEVAETLCLLQTKVAKHGRDYHLQEIALSDVNDGAHDGETPANGRKTVLLSSSSGDDSAQSDELSNAQKLEGVNDLEAYGGSMMDLVLGGWHHRHENPSKKSAATSYAAAVEVAFKPSEAVAPEATSISKSMVDAFGNPIEDMDMDLLSTAPARVRADPVLEDTSPVEATEREPREESADKVLAEAQQSLEEYATVLSETEKISLLGQTADESESHQAHEEGTTKKSRQHLEAKADSPTAQRVDEHKLVVKQKVLATKNVASKKLEVSSQKTDAALVAGEAQGSKGKPAKVAVTQPVRQQKNPRVSAVQ